MTKTVVAAFVVVALGTVATVAAQLKSVDERDMITPHVGFEAQVPAAHPAQTQRPTSAEQTGQATVPASAPSRMASEPPGPPRSTDGLEQRLREARQRQCNAEWERYHVAQARLCGLDDRNPKGARARTRRCDVHILGYEPSQSCR